MEFSSYIWIFLSYFGDIAYWLGFTISFLLIYLFLEERDKKRQKWILYYLLPAILLSYISSFFLKLVFKIPRVCDGTIYCPETYAFPSGHATIASAFSTMVFLLFSKNPKVYVSTFILAILVCYSRLALKVHTISDVVGGAIVGTIISLLWYNFFRKIENRKTTLRFYFRKFIHLAATTVIILRLTVETKYITAFTFFITSLFLISEILRLRKIYLPVIHEITRFCKKKEERGFLVEPFLFGLSLCILLFLPVDLFLAGSIPLIIGDAIAGLTGLKFGSHKLPYNKLKSIEGSLGFFISTFIILLLFFDLKISLFLSIFSMLLESVLKKYENLLLPIGSAIFYKLIIA